MCHQGQDTNKRHKEKYQIRKHIEQQASFLHLLLAFFHFYIISITVIITVIVTVIII